MSDGSIRPGERGAALLTVLLLVAVMGALAAAAMEKLRLTTALAINSAGLERARGFAIGLESLAALRIDDVSGNSPDRTTLAGGWNGAARRIPLPGGGLAETVVRDGGNCFNLNSLAEGEDMRALRPSRIGIDQFTALMRILEVPEGNARRIAEAAADWIDSDDDPGRGGAEDPAYRGLDQPHLTGGTLFAEVSELRAVAGMTPEIYRTLRPWLCALPVAELSPINVNTLSPEQAPLLAMLGPNQIRLDIARRVLAERPANGWGALVDFWQVPGMADVLPPVEVNIQPGVRTNWFSLRTRIEIDGAEMVETALIDARKRPARVALRRWGPDE